MNDEKNTQPQGLTPAKLAKIALGGGLIMGLLAVWWNAPKLTYWVYSFSYQGGQTLAEGKTGAMGDSWGAFTGLFTGISLLFVAWGMWIQSRSYQAQIKEMRQTQEAIANQEGAINNQIAAQMHYNEELAFSTQLAALTTAIDGESALTSKGEYKGNRAIKHWFELTLNKYESIIQDPQQSHKTGINFFNGCGQFIHAVYSIAQFIDGVEGEEKRKAYIMRAIGVVPRLTRPVVRLMAEAKRFQPDHGGLSLRDSYFVDSNEPEIIAKIFFPKVYEEIT